MAFQVVKRKQCQVLSKETKTGIIKQSERAQSITSNGQVYDVNHSTTGTTLKDKQKIVNDVRKAGSVQSLTVKKLSFITEEMEQWTT
jgi:hypothetical protein